MPRISGKERDAESGLDYFLARYYSGSQGRFTSPDPGPWIFDNPQSFNAYNYGLNNPLRFGDDDGLTAKDRVVAATSWLGIDYSSGGGHQPGPVNKTRGLDCSGLVLKAFEADPDNQLSLNGTAKGQATKLQAQGEFSKNIGDAQVGDAIFWDQGNGSYHAGLVVDIRDGKVYFIHAPKPGDKVKKFYVRVKQTALGDEPLVGVGRSIENRPAARMAAHTTITTSTGWFDSIYNWISSWWSTVQGQNRPADPEGGHKKNKRPPCLKDEKGNCVG